MLYRTVRFLVFLAFPIGLLYCSPLKGQNKDAGLWISVSFEAKLVKKLTFNISQEFRFNENISELGIIFTDAGVEYKLNKHFQVAFDYRYIKKRMVDDFYITRHRLYADIKYEKKIKPIQIQVRTRFSNYAEFSHGSDGRNPEFYLRNKLSLKWDLEKEYKPYISIELFSPLNYPRYSAFDNIRTTAGIEYDFTKHHKVDLYYMIQKELNVSHPETDFIVGLGYYYKL
jgi:hypothetical protein